MTHYIGLDAHSNTCTAVVMNSTGELKARATFDTSEKNLLELIKSVERPRFLAFEETNLAQWLYLLTKQEVDDLAIAHAAALPKQRGPKNDYRDAIRLAEEHRAGRIIRVYHEESKLWDLRTLVNSYSDITADLVRSKNRYKALLRSLGLFTEGSTVYNDTEILKSIEKEHDRFVAVNCFELIRSQQEIKDSYEGRFEKIAKQWVTISKLRSIPGIAAIRACIITSIICSPHRFVNKHKLWAYAMLVRYIDTSDGKVYSIRKPHGRTELKSTFIGAANTVLCGTSSLRKYYDRLRSRGISHNDAKMALARRIAAISLMVMKTGKKYDDKYEEKRRRLEKSET